MDRQGGSVKDKTRARYPHRGHANQLKLEVSLASDRIARARRRDAGVGEPGNEDEGET